MQKVLPCRHLVGVVDCHILFFEAGSNLLKLLTEADWRQWRVINIAFWCLEHQRRGKEKREMDVLMVACFFSVVVLGLGLGDGLQLLEVAHHVDSVLDGVVSYVFIRFVFWNVVCTLGFRHLSKSLRHIACRKVLDLKLHASITRSCVFALLWMQDLILTH